MTTTNRCDYHQPQDLGRVDPGIPNRAKHSGPNDGLSHLKAPFPGGSSYRGQFVAWGTGKGSGVIAPIISETVCDMPFHGKSTYKDYGDYGLGDVDYKGLMMHKTLGKSTYKNPLGPETPFLGETSNCNFFKPFKVGIAKGAPKLEKIDDRYPSFKSQYQTIYNDYTGTGPNKCPARMIYKEKEKRTEEYEKARESQLKTQE